MLIRLLTYVIAFSTITFFISCKKVDPKSMGPFYFKGKINNANLYWQASYSNGNPTSNFRSAMSDPAGSMPLDGTCLPNDSNYQFYLGTSIFEIHENSGIDQRNSISINFTRAGSTAYRDVKEEMKLLFTNGIKSYGLLRLFCNDPIADGIVITYTDNNNKGWKSKNINTGDFFEQVSLTNKKSSDGLYEKDWKARFSCKLYDDFGNFILAEDCEIFGPVFPS